MWGNLSDEYSRRVIKQYLCSQEIEAKQKSQNKAQLHLARVASLHKGGNRAFGGMIARLIRNCKFIILLVHNQSLSMEYLMDMYEKLWFQLFKATLQQALTKNTNLNTFI